MESDPTMTRYPSLPLILTSVAGGEDEANLVSVSRSLSGFGLQQFKEQFVHRHAAVLFDAAEVLHGSGGRLTQEGEGHDQFAGPPRVLWVVGGLVVLKGPVEDVLQSLNCL